MDGLDTFVTEFSGMAPYLLGVNLFGAAISFSTDFRFRRAGVRPPTVFVANLAIAGLAFAALGVGGFLATWKSSWFGGEIPAFVFALVGAFATIAAAKYLVLWRMVIVDRYLLQLALLCAALHTIVPIGAAVFVLMLGSGYSI
ncbi:MAG: hypothetical protein R3E66_24470 [bacterium]